MAHRTAEERTTMDNRPIGVFDSGVGGLTAMRQLIRLLPGERFVYFGDTGRVPYGGRSTETLIQYARQDVVFLRSFDPKAIVVACGTVSTVALSLLAEELPLPILGVVEPAARAAAERTKNGRVGVVGTKATIRSGAYERAIRGLKPGIEIVSRACPLLVPLVENGRVRPGDPVTEQVVAEYFAPLRAAGVDTLVLGCTHYPLLSELIGAYMGAGVQLIDTGRECASALMKLLQAQDLLAETGAQGEQRYYVSDSPEDFAELAEVFLGRAVAGQVERIAIERY